MAISEEQFDVWAKQGSVAQSRATYASVKNVLEDSRSPYYAKQFESFLQGSYGNDTNVYRDSDVDVVMRLDSTFYHDAITLPAGQFAKFEESYPTTATYGLLEFKAEVLAWLRALFSDVTSGSKALFIPGNSSRRDCDVLVCAEYRYYYEFESVLNQRFAEGIRFLRDDGTEIINFPKQHSANLTTKHQATNQWFKPTVRIFKNMRNRLVTDGALEDGIAPSYFIEGMLWNVPNQYFGRNYVNTFIETFNFLANADRSTFRCANNIHMLLDHDPNVSWSSRNCQAYLDALRDMWG